MKTTPAAIGRRSPRSFNPRSPARSLLLMAFAALASAAATGPLHAGKYWLAPPDYVGVYFGTPWTNGFTNPIPWTTADLLNIIANNPKPDDDTNKVELQSFCSGRTSGKPTTSSRRSTLRPRHGASSTSSPLTQLSLLSCGSRRQRRTRAPIQRSCSLARTGRSGC